MAEALCEVGRLWREARLELEHRCDPSRPECAEHLYYAHPENRRIVGPPLGRR